MGPAHRPGFRSRALLRSAGRGDAFAVWAFEMLTRRSLSSLHACGDFDIEKMRPE
jgi:hypothetical protein